jgi:hypothetical protein
VQSVLRYALFAAVAVTATALAVVAVAAVVGADRGSDRSGDLAGARRRWTSQGADDYRYRVRLSCFCGAEVTRPATVRVVAGRPRSTRTALRDYDTVDELFALIERARADANVVEVRYAPDTGVPIHVYIDWRANTSDDELTLTVSRIRVD